jgi:predicted GNAT family N-acyltransferase
MEKNIIFKEVVDKKDLEFCFRFRYEIHTASSNKDVIKENPLSIDFDIYDTHSKHYALYADDRIIGYIRIVLPAKEYSNDLATEVGKELNMINLNNTDSEKEKAPLPFLSYEGIPSTYNDYYNRVETANEKIGEASRLTILPEFRSISNLRFLVECALVIYVLRNSGKSNAVIDCSSRCQPLYEAYGFKRIDGEYTFHGLKKLALFLTSVPENILPKLKKMSLEFEETGKIEKPHE